MFITFEGIDGSGKTTQVQKAAELLRECGHRVLVTREPGGTALGEMIRELLLAKKDVKMSARAEVLLFNAARAQIIDDVIMPALKEGQIVICDRFYDSTIAYQGFGRQQNDKLTDMSRVCGYAANGLFPSATIYLKVPVDVAMERLGAREEETRFEDEDVAFYERVVTGYEYLIQQTRSRWIVVDGTAPVDKVHWNIAEVLVGPDVLGTLTKLRQNAGQLVPISLPGVRKSTS